MTRVRSILTATEGFPTWAYGLVVALISWTPAMGAPGPGLDASWNAGLAMAAKDGLAFGTEVVFSYGPLGFLQGQFVWFPDLAVLSFLYLSALYVGFCIALVWALRRTLPGLASAAVAFVAVAVLPLLDQPLLIAALAALELLRRERSSRYLWTFIVLGASFAALHGLIKLSTGPVIIAVFGLALIGARARPAQIAAFLGIFLAESLALWLAAGQSLATIPDFLLNTAEIVSGYSSSMLPDLDVPPWQATAATIAAAAVSVAVMVAATRGEFGDRRARNWGLATIGVATFIVFKEGVVRTDAGHLSLFFSSACVLWIAIPWARRRLPLLAGAAAILLLGLPVRPEGLPTNLGAADNLRFAFEQARNLASPGRRADLAAAGRANLQTLYALDPPTLAALRGREVAIEPWEIGAAWAYELDWQPLPVFQNYSAYTDVLDRLNAEAVADPDGPERILRESPRAVYPEFMTEGLDGRFPGWDPPAQQRAVLCNFEPLLTSDRWQVLARVEDRCGPARPAGSEEAGEGEPVPVPAPGPGEVVFVRIEGAEVSGLERLTTTLLHARKRALLVNGTTSHRLIPETAADGLLLRGDPRLAAEQGPFAPFPGAETIAVEGAGGGLRFEFFRMRVAAQANSRPGSSGASSIPSSSTR